MKLSKKIRIFTFIFTIFTLFIVSGIIEFFGDKNYYNVESIFFYETKEVSHNVITDEYNDLKVLLVDWANWTNTYNFIDGENSDYVSNNFGLSTFQELNIDFVMIFDENMDLKYDAYYDGYKINHIKENYINEFLKSRNKIGIVEIDGDYILVSSQKITDSEGESPKRGMFLFGRKLEENELLKIKNNIGNNIKVSLGERVFSDYRYNYGISSELFHNRNEESYYEIVLPVLNNNKSMYMKIALNDEISLLGEKYKNSYLILAVIILITFGIVLDQMFRWIVVRRILKLNSEIKSVFSDDNILDRVTVEKYNDELSEVSKNINTMLDKIDIMNKELYNSATYDKMTGVFNRDAGIKKLESIIEKRTNADALIAIIYIDIDNLKEVNDSYGHIIGDKLIIDTVKLLKENIGENDCIVRLGGDEFLILLNGETYEPVEKIISKIKLKNTEFNSSSNSLYDIEMSIGSAIYDNIYSTEEFIDKADKNMYLVKKDKKEKKDKNI